MTETISEALKDVRLTNRETQVLQSLIKNHGRHKDVGKELFISHTTFRTHLNNLYSKLFSHNTAELILVALENGIIQLNKT